MDSARSTFRRLLILLTLACCGFATQAFANCLNSKRLLGVNLSGAEGSADKLPGVLNKDYIYPTLIELTYFQSIGANVIRLPIRWERIQPVLFDSLSATEVGYIRSTLTAAQALGFCVILDVHNYGMYRGNIIGSTAVPERALTDLWLRVSAAFPESDYMAFGLMNEPFKLSITNWARIAQNTVNELRKKGSQHLVLVPGGRWTGAHDWFLVAGGIISNAQAFAGFQDSANNFVIEMHQYVDTGYSGTQYEDCVDPELLRSILSKVSDWARTNKVKLFLGEFGTSSSSACLKDLDALLSSMTDGSVWRGWSYWAGGRWWGTYPFSIYSSDGKDAPQTKVLRKYLLPAPSNLQIVPVP